ncbi:MAG: TlpA disulfide reductase family protein [Gammaproteobacteria bacterium]
MTFSSAFGKPPAMIAGDRARRLLVFLCCLWLTGTAAAAGRIGLAAPDFTLKDLDGQPHALAQMRRHGHVLLIFWATECVYCHALLPEFKNAQARYGGHGLTVAAINIGGEHREEVAAYVKDYRVNYLTLAERAHNLDVAQAYGVIGTPTIVLVSPAGTILYYGHKLPRLERWLGKPAA